MNNMTVSRTIAAQIKEGALQQGYLAGTAGFNPAVISAITKAMDADDLEGFGLKDAEEARAFVHESIMSARSIIPDAWVIDTEKKIVCAYEVEDTHLLTTDKMIRYHELASNIESFCWEFVMMPVTRFGRCAGCYDIDQLEHFSFQYINDQLKATA